MLYELLDAKVATLTLATHHNRNKAKIVVCYGFLLNLCTNKSMIRTNMQATLNNHIDAELFTYAVFGWKYSNHFLV